MPLTILNPPIQKPQAHELEPLRSHCILTRLHETWRCSDGLSWPGARHLTESFGYDLFRDTGGYQVLGSIRLKSKVCRDAASYDILQPWHDRLG